MGSFVLFVGVLVLIVRSGSVDGNESQLCVSMKQLLTIQQLEELQTAVNVLLAERKQGSDWQLVFKGVAGTGINLFDLWTNTAWDSGPRGHCNYRNEALFKAWNDEQLNIKQVMLSLYDQTGVKVELVFNGADSDILSWFAKERLVSSPWSDLTTAATTNYFSITGHDSRSLSRRFFINKNYGGCSADRGWLVVVDSKFVCSWENPTGELPHILYSPQSNSINWEDALDAGTLGVADYLTIHIKSE